MKDNDFLSDKLKISIGEEAKEKLLETLAADVEFLTRLVILFHIVQTSAVSGYFFSGVINNFFFFHLDLDFHDCRIRKAFGYESDQTFFYKTVYIL